MVQRLDDRVVLPGGAELIVVSPRVAELRKLRTKWQTTLEKANFTPGTADCVMQRMDAKYQPPPAAERDASGAPDTEIPNGSSIAILFTYDRRRLLLAADAHTAVLAESIDGLIDRFGVKRLELAAFKLSHHGSAGNLSKELLQRIDCTRFVVSTNGDYFGHPHKKAIEMIAAAADPGRTPTVVFNYDGRTTEGVPRRARHHRGLRHGRPRHGRPLTERSGVVRPRRGGEVGEQRGHPHRVRHERRVVGVPLDDVVGMAGHGALDLGVDRLIAGAHDVRRGDLAPGRVGVIDRRAARSRDAAQAGDDGGGRLPRRRRRRSTPAPAPDPPWSARRPRRAPRATAPGG